jgi:hypothetical protein
MNQKQVAVSETREHATDNGELTLQIKVLRSKLRTSLKGGTTGGGGTSVTDVCTGADPTCRTVDP